LIGAMLAVVGSISLLAGDGPVPPHVVVIAAETLVQRNQPEAARLIAREALASPGLTRAERARLHLVNAMLLPEKDDLGRRKALGAALSLDRTVSFPGSVPAQLREMLEDARSMLPPASGPSPAPSPGEAAGRVPPARSLIHMVDVLYKDLQIDAADIVLQVAKQYEPFTAGDQVQIAVRRGIVKMDLFDDAGARRAFQQALDLDRSIKLPDYAPPKTTRQFNEMRAALQPVRASGPDMGPAPSKKEPMGGPLTRPWAWTAIGGGVLGATSGVLYLLAKDKYDLLATHSPTITGDADLTATANAGRALQTGSGVVLGAAAAALIGSIVLYQLDHPSTLHATVQVSAGAVTIGVGGALP